MFKFAPTHFLTFPTLILASLSLSACSGHGFNSQGFSGANGARYAGGNCAPAACATGGGYGNYGGASYGGGQMANTSYGSYNGGAVYGGGQSYGGKTRYGNSGAASVSGQVAGYQQYVYAQQMASYAAPQYSTPQSYTQSSYTQSSYGAPTQSSYSSPTYAAPANCPAGTTASNDGTCLMGGSVSTSTKSAGDFGEVFGLVRSNGRTRESINKIWPQMLANISHLNTSLNTAKDCPAGTSASSDGTCLMGGSGDYSTGGSYSGPTYSGGSTGGSSSVTAPPISSYDWSNSNTRWGSSNYVSPSTRSVDTDGMSGGVAGNKYPSQTNTTGYDYRPVRK